MTDLDNSLRAMLRERSADIPSLPADFADLASLDVLAGGAEVPDHRRPRWWTLMAAAAIVAAVVGTAVGIKQLTDRHDSRPAAPSPTPTSVVTPPPTPTPRPHNASRLLAWSFDLVTPAGYQLMDRAVTPTFGAAALRLLGDPDAVGCCGSLPKTTYVNVYRRGAYDPAAVNRGTPVQVGTKQGRLATIPAGPFDAMTKISHDALPTLAWQYAPNAWATVQATTPTSQQVDQLLLIARAVRPGHAVAVSVPLRLGYVPTGLRFVEATQNLPETYGTTIMVGDGMPGLETTTMLSIQVWSDAGHHETGPSTPITVDGRAATLFDDGAVSILIGGHDVVLGLNGPRRSSAELMKVLAAVQWAPNVSDPKGWFAGTTMLP